MKKYYLPFLWFIVLYSLLTACKKGDSVNSAAGAGGSTARMTISGNYMYIVSSNKLYTYDISRPAQTVLLNEQYISWSNVETIFPYRDKLFIGSQQGMFVFDNSNPKSPKLQGQAQHFRACDPVVADDDYAYVTLRNSNIECGGTLNQLQIYDIRGNNILTPKMISTLDMPEPNGLGYKDDILYVCMGNNGMNVISITDKTNPAVIKTITGNTFIDVIPYNDLLIAYVQGGIVLYDISAPANPKLLSTIQN